MSTGCWVHSCVAVLDIGHQFQLKGRHVCCRERAENRAHLIVVEKSTLQHWTREVAAYAPHLKTVILDGPAQARAEIIKQDIYADSPAGSHHPGALLPAEIKVARQAGGCKLSCRLLADLAVQAV